MAEYEFDLDAHTAMMRAQVAAGNPGALLHFAQMVVGAAARYPLGDGTAGERVREFTRAVIDLVEIVARPGARERGAWARAGDEVLALGNSILIACDRHSHDEHNAGRLPAHRLFPDTTFHAIRLAEPSAGLAPDVLAALLALHRTEAVVNQLARGGALGDAPDAELADSLGEPAASVGEAWARLRAVLDGPICSLG